MRKRQRSIAPRSFLQPLGLGSIVRASIRLNTRSTTVASSRSISLRAERTKRTLNSRTTLQFARFLQAPADGIQAVGGLSLAFACYRHVEDVLPQGGIGAQINLHRRAAPLGVDEVLHTAERGRHIRR